MFNRRTVQRNHQERKPNDLTHLFPRRTGPPGPCSQEALEGALLEQAKLNPDLTLDELCELFEELYGVKVSNATMSRAFKRLKLPLKKSVL